MNIIRKCLNLASDTKQTWWICPMLFLWDAALSVLVVRFIQYTEIDWKTYMQQVARYIAGERDYYKLYGDTGPLVYPAAHVYIYRGLYAITDQGQDIRLAQHAFIGLYLATLVLVMMCYRQARAPPYIFPLLVVSKRLHSIFLLRLFNDCFAIFFLFLAIHCYQRRFWTIGSLAYSLGLAVKMSLLLALPAIGVILWEALGRNLALRRALNMLQLQIILGVPFFATNPWAYGARAFEFTRQFLFKWTVNWRFVGEETFLSSSFSGTLLVAHVSLLALFASTRWLHAPLPEAIKQLIEPPSSEAQARIGRRVSPDFILTSILSSVIIGCLCARSLHYQFYAYVCWSTPFLLWRSGMHPVLVYAIWITQEWAWNVYPSSQISSMVVVASFLIMVLSIWLGTKENIAIHTNGDVMKRTDD